MFKERQMLASLMSDEVRNVIIIGSGPAGYTAGLYSARAMLEPLMFAGYMSGGQLMLTSDIENFPGYPQGRSALKKHRPMTIITSGDE